MTIIESFILHFIVYYIRLNSKSLNIGSFMLTQIDWLSNTAFENPEAATERYSLEKCMDLAIWVFWKDQILKIESPVGKYTCS